MEPNFKLLLDEMAGLNRHFDAYDDRSNRRFSDLERGLNDHASAVDSCITVLEESLTANSDNLARRVAKLEADPFALGASAVASRLATLEASYTNRDMEFTQRLSHLESLRIGPNSIERDDRVKQLEATTADPASWCPSVDGVLDNVHITVKKLEKSRDSDVFDAMSHEPGLLPTPTKALASSRDRDVFDTMSHGSGLLPTPTKAAMQVSAGFTANPPVMGHHVESTPRDSGSGVVTTWIPVPGNDMTLSLLFFCNGQKIWILPLPLLCYRKKLLRVLLPVWVVLVIGLRRLIFRCILGNLCSCLHHHAKTRLSRPLHSPIRLLLLPQKASCPRSSRTSVHWDFCFKCSAKWSKDHKCSPEVLLVVEGIWDSLLESSEDSNSTSFDTADAQLLLALSKAAFGSAESGHAIYFAGSIQSHAVSVSIDSGSSASFISVSLAAKLVDVSVMPVPSTVRVAGCGLLQSSQLLVQVPWTIEQVTFVTDFRVLQLTSYDLIVAMDWLEQFSPMQVHWLQKWMMIPYQGQWILLQGLNADMPDKMILLRLLLSSSLLAYLTF
ncbi:unnamed protein product [Miscanthus lutarioriparius]|uniref:Uncharacterized protein n=1 Tax=Miscanthus lutarioriparius TaxID=422564 RepID=A0A811MRB8_9POAL|nr:unnamed protein product [Miscanthus lutarioriparius]